MGDFLMVAPDGYLSISASEFFIQTGYEPMALQQVFNSGAYWELFPLFEQLGLIVDGQRITDYKVFDTGSEQVIFYTVGNEV